MRRPNFVPRAAPPAGRRIQSLQTSGRQGNPAAQSTSSSRPSVGSGHQQFASPSHCSPTFSRDPSIQSVRLWCVIFFFTSLLLIRERLFGKVGTSHTFCPFGPPPCPRTVLPQASCISIRFLQTKVNCVKVWSWNAEIWFKKKMHFASTQKLPRGGMYWGIHPPRTERFPEDGNFAQRFLRNSSI